MVLTKANQLAILVALAFGLFMMDAASALAATSQSTPGQVLKPNLWALAVGVFVPVVTYLLNHAGPWVKEAWKGPVLLLTSTIAGALTELIDKGNIGFDSRTLNFVVSAVVAAFAAHHALYKPSETNIALGGGTNRQDTP